MVTMKILGVTCRYNSIDALRDVTIEFREGEITGVIGPNGAGKTTLLRCLARMLKPISGAVYIDGRDIWSMKLREVAKLVAYSSVEIPNGFNTSVMDFLLTERYPHSKAFWETNRDIESIERALRMVDSLSYAERKLNQLSSGELQRVMIAKLLVHDAKIFLLDEPTLHLDIKYQLSILDLIKSITKKRRVITVMAIHDLNLASMFCDRLILLSKGRIVATGSPEEVITPENILKTYEIKVKVVNDPNFGIIVIPVRS